MQGDRSLLNDSSMTRLDSDSSVSCTRAYNTRSAPNFASSHSRKAA